MPINPTAPAIEANAPVAGIMVGAPMYGGVCFDAFLLGVWDLQHECHKLGITLGLNTIRNESLIPRARNRILADFMESQCSHLIMIDSDIGFAGRDVLRLVAHNKPLIGATYAKKDRTKYAPAFVPMAGPVFQREDDGLAEVECLPGGFMMIQRETVAQMRGRFHDLWYWDQHGGEKRAINDLFGCYTDENRQFWSEDYAFCQRWRTAGGQVWMDPYIQLTHNGTTTFDGDPMAIFGEAPAQPGKTRRNPAKPGIRIAPEVAAAIKDEFRGVFASPLHVVPGGGHTTLDTISNVTTQTGAAWVTPAPRRVEPEPEKPATSYQTRQGDADMAATVAGVL